MLGILAKARATFCGLSKSIFGLYLLMQFSEILGQEQIKAHLSKTAESGRIPHAQLFVGPEGSGMLPIAIAYAQILLCGKNEDGLSANAQCDGYFQEFAHPDLHFCFPTVTEGSKMSKYSDFSQQWRAMLKGNVYSGLVDWYSALDVKNKQGIIRVADAQEILRVLSLKSYGGGYKVMIIWMADKMNVETANKLLKLLEEPLPKTVLILITENEQDILQTIKSRCQTINFNALSEKAITDALVDKIGVEKRDALKIAHQSQGNYNKALKMLSEENEDDQFEIWFVEWVRAAFRAKGNASAISQLIKWSEMVAGLGRETQKNFLQYCITMFRQALILNYQATSLVYMEPKTPDFSLEKFAPFVNAMNINDIFREISDAIYHIERNGNPKTIMLDLSIKLTRLIHKK